jgi:magnesium chelatase subunit I
MGRQSEGRAQAPRTLGELRASGYRLRTVREEMRSNLLTRLEQGERVCEGIIGFDDSVLPEIENAVLAGHHMVFLGERGQAKSRIIRALVGLLDREVPVVNGCEINDDPERPLCKRCRERFAAEREGLEIDWMERLNRFTEKLATPDITMADLIGEIDPVKVAEGRYLADEETIHYGLIPRTNRGIFAINELPDLTEKVQVGLFNLMEEKDVQIKGYKVRLPLDIVIVASANPEDYTSRGRIITPLKDRFDAQIRTHYPRTIEDEIAIIEQELPVVDRLDRSVHVPPFLKEIIARLTFEARESPEINQSSGVSVRVSINNYESVISNAEKRAVRQRQNEIVPRPSDLYALFASTAGKIEIEYSGEERKEEEVIERLLQRAIVKVFDKYFHVDELRSVVAYFEAGWGVQVGDAVPADEYLECVLAIPGLQQGLRVLGGIESPGFIAAASEFIFEGLHLHQRLNKERAGGRFTYRAA